MRLKIRQAVRRAQSKTLASRVLSVALILVKEFQRFFVKIDNKSLKYVAKFAENKGRIDSFSHILFIHVFVPPIFLLLKSAKDWL